MWNNLSQFSKTPEMRAFWLLLPFLIAASVVDVVYLRYAWLWISVAINLAIAAVALIASYKAAELNRSVQTERGELKNIIFSMEDALVAYDTSFRVIYFNPSAEKLFGMRQDAVLGKIIQPQDAQRPGLRRLTQVIFPSLAPVMIPQSAANTYPQIFDLSFTDPELELRVSTSPIGGESGGLLGFVKIAHNRTREVSLLRSKDEFVTVASHQLRTPMTEITWALEAIQNTANLDETTKGLVEHTLNASRGLVKITEDLLSIAKIEEGHFGYKFEKIDVVQFVEKVLEQVLALVNQAGLKIYFEKPESVLPSAIADGQKVTIVLVNLLENAIRYNIKNGEITVKVEKTSDAKFAKISVHDTGIGIPQDQVKKLFTKFFRAENAVKYQTKGSGLGLYIAQSIIRGHGGQMGVESEVNRGSIFYFTLPLDPALVPPKEVPVGF